MLDDAAQLHREAAKWRARGPALRPIASAIERLADLARRVETFETRRALAIYLARGGRIN